MFHRLSFVACLLAVPLLSLTRPAAAVQYVGPNCTIKRIQDAIGKESPPQIIYVAPGTYNETVGISYAGSVTITGGYTQGCAAGSPGGDTTISGMGLTSRVVTVTGNSDLKLSNLTIRDGANGPDGTAGGIGFFGYGKLTLESVFLSNNTAGYGAGLGVSPTAHTEVMLSSGTFIGGNTAIHDGGGIHIDGDTRLFVVDAQTNIYSNHADNGNGGGIDIVGPARADINSIIVGNTAMYGGGISVIAGSNGAAVVRIYTADPQSAGGVAVNFASQAGGGAYLKPFNNTGSAHSAALCAYNFLINGNTAPNAAAIYASVDQPFSSSPLTGSQVFLNTDSNSTEFQCNPEPVSALGGVACADGTGCNQISNNDAADGTGSPTGGSTIVMQDGGRLQADRVSLKNNSSGSVLSTIDNGSGNSTSLTNCLFADNSVTYELISAVHNSFHSMSLNHCTLAHNTIGGNNVIHTQSSFTLNDSIVAENKPTLEYAGPIGGLSLNYILSNDVSTLSACVGCFTGDPQFVSVADRDYHLQSTSPALDHAPVTPGLDLDLDGKPRNTDLPVPNVNGPSDLGAYERQPDDRIFANGFQ